MQAQDQKKIERLWRKNMKKIKLNESLEKDSSADGYSLNPTEKYVINIEEEMEFQMAIMMSFQIMGSPPALKNYHA